MPRRARVLCGDRLCYVATREAGSCRRIKAGAVDSVVTLLVRHRLVERSVVDVCRANDRDLRCAASGITARCMRRCILCGECCILRCMLYACVRCVCTVASIKRVVCVPPALSVAVVCLRRIACCSCVCRMRACIVNDCTLQVVRVCALATVATPCTRSGRHGGLATIAQPRHTAGAGGPGRL